MNEERRMFWQQIAESHPTVTFRSAEAQLNLLQVAPESLKGKTILVLGPGGDFALEKRMAEARPELIVPLSYTYDEHEVSPEEVREQQPIIQPIKGLFQELPPAYKSFDYIFSVYGFPFYTLDRKNLEKGTYKEEVKIHLSNLIDLLAEGGEARLVPFLEDDIQALEELQKERQGIFSVTLTSVLYAPESSSKETLVVIRKLEKPQETTSPFP